MAGVRGGQRGQRVALVTVQATPIGQGVQPRTVHGGITAGASGTKPARTPSPGGWLPRATMAPPEDHVNAWRHGQIPAQECPTGWSNASTQITRPDRASRPSPGPAASWPRGVPGHAVPVSAHRPATVHHEP